MVGVGCQNLFLFVRVLKWCLAEGGDFPHVVLPVSLTGTCRSHKFGDGAYPRGLLSLILHVNVAQVSNICCRCGCDTHASHRGGCREKWGVTQLGGDQNTALYRSSAIASMGQSWRRSGMWSIVVGAGLFDALSSTGIC